MIACSNDVNQDYNDLSGEEMRGSKMGYQAPSCVVLCTAQTEDVPPEGVFSARTVQETFPLTMQVVHQVAVTTILGDNIDRT